MSQVRKTGTLTPETQLTTLDLRVFFFALFVELARPPTPARLVSIAVSSLTGVRMDFNTTREQSAKVISPTACPPSDVYSRVTSPTPKTTECIFTVPPISSEVLRSVQDLPSPQVLPSALPSLRLCLHFGCSCIPTRTGDRHHDRYGFRVSISGSGRLR